MLTNATLIISFARCRSKTSLNSERRANLLIDMSSNYRRFSERGLKSFINHLDFDSAIPWFESRRPSQPVWSPTHLSASMKIDQHFRRLPRNAAVSRERIWPEGAFPVDI
jgi:hypothetical protein